MNEAIELLLRSVAVATATLGVAALLQRSSASARAFVLTDGFAALLALPTLGRFSPAWGPEVAASSVQTRPMPPAATFDPLLAIWIGGIVFGVLGTLRSLLGLRRVLAQCSPMDGVVGRVMISPESYGPFTCGLFRPTIVLPSEARAWSAERVESVVRHESAHIARHDWTRLLLVRIVRCLYWPNPLVWAMERQLRLACEQACDDHVLMAGADAPTYAAELVELARGRRVATTVSMSEPSSLERRLRSILSDVRRTAPSRRWQVGALVLAMVAATGFGSFRVRTQHLRPVLASPSASLPNSTTPPTLLPTRSHPSSGSSRKPLLVRDLKPSLASRRASHWSPSVKRAVGPVSPTAVPTPNPPSGALMPSVAPEVSAEVKDAHPTMGAEASDAILVPSMPRSDTSPTLQPARAAGGGRGGGGFGSGGPRTETGA